MYKYILETAGNINWMALFALLTFFFVFTMSIYMAFIKDKKELDEVAHLPLVDDDPLIKTQN
jgi:cbb3-type cytochrome oxidase subunit 3